ncbi:MAG: zf-HC2 domain-containing protein [Blastocatellia bacterium]
MSDKAGTGRFWFAWHPTGEEILTFLDGECPESEATRIRVHLEGCWSCRRERERIDTAVAAWMDAIAADRDSGEGLSPEGVTTFRSRLRDRAQREPTRQGERIRERRELHRQCFPISWWFRSLGESVQGSVRGALLAVGGLLLALGAVGGSWPRTVSAEELLSRTRGAEQQALERISQPVIYRRLEVRRSNDPGVAIWESWTDQDGRRFQEEQGGGVETADELIRELGEICRVNRLDAGSALSATAFSTWRRQVEILREEVNTVPGGYLPNGEEAEDLVLTVTTAEPHVEKAIIEASLWIRGTDWHAVGLRLQVQGESGPVDYELLESAYSLVPRQALRSNPSTGSPQPLVSEVPAIVPSAADRSLVPSMDPPVPSRRDLLDSQLAVRYALHELHADLGEQIEVAEADAAGSAAILVSGLVETEARRALLDQRLRTIPHVQVRLLTVAEAMWILPVVDERAASERPRPSVPTSSRPALEREQGASIPQEIDEEDLAGVLWLDNLGGTVSNDRTIGGAMGAGEASLFERRLLDALHHQARAESLTVTPEGLARTLTERLGMIEADSRGALASGWALRRLVPLLAAEEELSPLSRQQLETMVRTHLGQVRHRILRLTEILSPLWSTTLAPAKLQAPLGEGDARWTAARTEEIFQRVEQIARAIDSLLAARQPSSDQLEELARTLQTDLTRLVDRISLDPLVPISGNYQTNEY